jgi:hypothetical protein
MSQEIINTGDAPNDGTGDPLRTAFQKTDDNFDQIWAAGPVGSNVRIQGNTISTTTVNTDLSLSPNGAANIRLNNNTVPGANNTWYLGSATNRWRGVFLGTGNLDVLGNVTIAGNLTAGNISYTGNVFVGDLQGSVFADDSTLIVDAINNAVYADVIAASGNITAQNFTGNITITGNVQGTSANVTLVAGAYEWTFDNTGNLTLPGNTFSVNYANNTPVDVVTRFEDVWTVPTGNSTQSFTVDANNTYQMWVEGNIPNGIIAWNATATITNTNVPVVGAQYAWNYEGGGNILMFNSIPAQIIGTAGAISNAEPAVGNTTNVFSFGINNASGNVANVRYGWIKIS